MIVTRAARLLCGLGLLHLAVAGPGDAQQPEVERYYASTRDICRTGVTPEIEAAYAQAQEALERARAAGSLGGNFAGIKPPQHIWLDCFQSPGDGNT